MVYRICFLHTRTTLKKELPQVKNRLKKDTELLVCTLCKICLSLLFCHAFNVSALYLHGQKAINSIRQWVPFQAQTGKRPWS